jgi:phosphoribosylanthranilate isomerase
MLTVPVLNEASVIQAQRLSAATHYILLDSAHPVTGNVGATGLIHDWALSRRIVESCAALTILAGGLGPTNVREASKPYDRLGLTLRPRPVGTTTAEGRIPTRWGSLLSRLGH